MTDEVAGVENDGLENGGLKFGGLRNEGLKIFQFCKCQSPVTDFTLNLNAIRAAFILCFTVCDVVFACNCNTVITHDIASFTFSCKDYGYLYALWH